MKPTWGLDLIAEASSGQVAASGAVLVVMLAISAAFYFLPAIIGVSRGVPNVVSLVVVNVFLGWTLIGWVVALAWAFATVRPRYVPRRSGSQAGPDFSQFVDP